MRNHWIYVAVGFVAGAALFLSTAWQRMPPAEEVTLKLEKTSRLQAPHIQTSFVMERFGPPRTLE
ncbi:hypothetical protein AU381_16670 [Sinorhizobium glycinis]|uniref:Uncharacterized protein n=1 Tax=Sinorhizobium glycinis TaxID=1472378 RepID=A0A178XKR3_9HYPH|nr:hypothetical protein [Sinorhizobium glycinis]OAP35818.1 hypothetical protein AU381_16670 [Sinorhizobium glycinis]